MIDKKWILYCNIKKKNAFVSTAGERYMSYQDFCNACGHIIYTNHSQAKITKTKNGNFVIVPEEKIKLERKFLWFNKEVKTEL